MQQPGQIKKILSGRQIWILDGAVGTELEKRGYITSLSFWTAFAAYECPELLSQVHQEYLDAGADILTANTFRLSHYLFEKEGRLSEFLPLLETTCVLAEVCCRNYSGTLIAGSLATLEDCYRPDLTPTTDVLEHYHQIQLKLLAGFPIDLVLAETINTQREALVIARLCSELNLPLVLSFITNGKGQLLSGEDLGTTIRLAAEWNPIAISLNCRPLADLRKDRLVLAKNFHGIQCIYPNAPGKPDCQTGWLADANADEQMNDFFKSCEATDPLIIGGCCGTTPSLIRKLRTSYPK